MNRARRVFISLGAALVLVGLVAALVLALRPLPTLSEWDGQVGWCGPGSKSSNALQVWLNPDIVNPNTGEFHNQILKDFCVGEANNRMTEAALGLIAALVPGGAVMFVSGSFVRRAPEDDESKSV